MKQTLKANFYFFYIKRSSRNYFFTLYSKNGRLVCALTSKAMQIKNKKLQFNLTLEKMLKQILLTKIKILFIKLFKIKYRLVVLISRMLEKHKIKIVVLIMKKLSPHNGCRQHLIRKK
jgi:hypothetical protein